MFLQMVKDAEFEHDDRGTMRRLYPWKGQVDSTWGSAWVTLKPGKQTRPHWHDEEETFIIVSGTGVMTVDGETRAVAKGDVIYLPRCSSHSLRNSAPDEVLEMLCIWWGGDETTMSHDMPEL